MTPSKIKWVTYLRCSNTTVWRKVTKETGGGVAGGSWVCRKAVGAGSSEAAFEHRLVGGEEERHFHI